MAEDDDDEAFGDFALAPFQSNSQFNGLNSLAAAEDDDEWGEFVQTPQQSKPSEISAKGNHQSDKFASPTTWVKPSGAIPLSIFGDVEEEEEVNNFAGSRDLNQGKSNGNGGDFKSTLVDNGVSKSQSFTITDLYNQFSQIKPENLAGSDSTGKFDSVENGFFSSSNQNDARSAASESKNVDLSDALGISDHNNHLANKSDNKEFGSKSYVSDSSEKEDLFGGWTPELNGFSSDLNATPQNVQMSSSGLDKNGQKHQSTGSNTAVDDDDDDDDGWEFKDASLGFQAQEVNNNVSKNSHSFTGTQIKSENPAGSPSIGKVDSVENRVYSSSNQNDVRSAVTELTNVDLNDMLGTSDPNQLTNKSNNDEFSFKSYVPNPSKENFFGGWTLEFNGLSSNLNTTPQNVQKSSSGLFMNGQKQQLDGASTDDDDDDDDGWEFKDAYSGFQAQEVNNNVNIMVHEVSERSVYSSGTGIGSNKSLDLFETSNGSINFFARSTEPVDYFANSSGISLSGTGIGPNKSLALFETSIGSINFFARSNEPVDQFANLSAISSTSPEVNLIQPSMATLNGFTSDTNSFIEQNKNEGLLNYRTDVEIEDLDEDFGEFTAASAETGPKPGEVSTVDAFSPVKHAVSTPDQNIQEEDMKLNHHKGAIPLSIFGDEEHDEEPKSGGSSDVQDVFVQQSTSEQRNNHTATKVISINDLISNLYSQSEQTSSINTAQNPNKTLPDPSSGVSSSNPVNDDDLLDDSSWNFKDASQIRVDGEASLISTGDTYMSVSSKLKLNNYLDFYSELKEELYFVAKCHVESLKQARGTAAISNKDAGAASVDGEFQLVCKELEQMNVLSEESSMRDYPSGDSHLNEFAQVLLEPQFQRLESEYHLSQKLLQVEKDLGSAMELMRHTNAMLKMLTIGTLEEQKVYVSLWSEILSVCAQELKHGALIWNQAAEKHVQSQLLSEPQGSKFVLALGEIYRVVVVLEASAKLFKPWVLSSLVDSAAIYSLLEVCHAVWSTSGLEDALSSVSAPIALENTSLFKSIKHILGLDVLVLQNYVFAEKERRCCLSLLTAGVVPDLKMIMWGDEQCFVTLANLCANLISREPPKLPHISLG